MTSEEYVKTLVIDSKEIKVGLDDYGQQYFIEWVDEDGNTRECGLGAYNFYYEENIYYMFDKRFKELKNAEFLRELTTEEIEELEKYYNTFEKD